MKNIILTIALMILGGCCRSEVNTCHQTILKYEYNALPNFIKSVKIQEQEVMIEFSQPMIDLRNTNYIRNTKYVTTVNLHEGEIFLISGISMGDPLRLIKIFEKHYIFDFYNGRSNIHYIYINNENSKPSAQQGDAPEPDSCRSCLSEAISRPGDL